MNVWMNLMLAASPVHQEIRTTVHGVMTYILPVQKGQKIVLYVKHFDGKVADGSEGMRVICKSVCCTLEVLKRRQQL